MARELVTKALNASFVRTGYVRQMNVIVTQYSVANRVCWATVDFISKVA
jgi:hypothetical protein